MCAIRSFVVFLIISSCIGCSQPDKSAVPVYEQKITDTVKAVIRAGNKVRAKNDYTGALDYYKKAIALAKSQKDNVGLVEAYRNYIFVNGAILNRKEDALTMLNEAIPFAHELGDANTLCDMYGLKGVAYQASGELDSAIAANKLALQYMEEDIAPDSLKNWPLYLNVAGLYSQLGNQKIAIEYTNRYLKEYAKKRNDTARMVSSYSNLSIYHTLVGDSAIAYQNARAAYALDKLQNGDDNVGVSVRSNMISMYINQKCYDSAKILARKNYEAYKQQENIVGVQKTINQLIEIALESKDKLLAEEILKENNALDLFGNDDFPLADIKKALDGSYRLYKMLGDEQRAYHYLQPAYETTQELRKQEINKDLEKYELERKKIMQENVILAKEVQIKKKSNTILVLLITFLLMGAVAAFALLVYRRKTIFQKRKMEMMEKETKWEMERSLLKGQLEERNRISRELHDDLGASLTSIALSGEIIKSRNPDLKEELAPITNSANEIIDTLNEIVWSLNSRNDSLLGLVAYIRKFASGYLSRMGIEFAVTETLPEDDTAVTSNIRRAVYLTAKEAINNIVKHSNATIATMDISFVDDRLSIKISDNGRGLDAGTNAKIGGNGLSNMQKNMELIGGSLDVESDKGTIVKFECSL